MSQLLADTLAAIGPGARLDTGVVVAAAAGNMVTVNISGAPVTIARAAAYANPVKGDVALIAVTDDGRTYALLALSAGSPPPPPPPPPQPQKGETTFPAAAAGTYRGGNLRSDRSDVIEGDWGNFGRNVGMWAYGTAPAGTLAGASITGAVVLIDRRFGGWNAAQHINLIAHNNTGLPQSQPGIVAGPQSIGTVAVGGSAWLPVPLEWAKKIAAGTWRGLGIANPGGAADPYVVLASLSQNGSTGALRLTWQR